MLHRLVENYMISCLNLYQIGHQRSYRYAEDNLYNKNSTSILLMLCKYHEFWGNISSFSKWYCRCMKFHLQKEYQVEMDRESNKLFWTTLFHQIFMAWNSLSKDWRTNYYKLLRDCCSQWEIIFMGKLQL